MQIIHVHGLVEFDLARQVICFVLELRNNECDVIVIEGAWPRRQSVVDYHLAGLLVVDSA